MIYTIEQIQTMLKLWAAWRDYGYDNSDDYRLLGCGSPTYAAMQHAKGYIRQDKNCRAVYHQPKPLECVTLINAALDAMEESQQFFYVVGTIKENDGSLKVYTQGRLLRSVITRRYRYGMGIRRIGVHVGRVLRGEGKGRASNDKVEGLLYDAHQYLCDYLNQRVKVGDLVESD